MPSSSTHPLRIALISASVLILELAFIRQVPAEVKSISYFSNLILMSSFFGLGLGCLLAKTRSLLWLLPLGLLATFSFVYFARGLVVFEAAGQVHYWLEPPLEEGVAPHLSLFLSAALAFISTCLPFIGLGQALVQEMDKHARLRAYSWDIGGSLFGTVFFALGAYLEVPPWVFPPLVGIIIGLCCAPGLAALALCALAGAPFFFFAQGAHPSYWSPYYLVQYKQEEQGVRVWVNSSFHQFAVNFRQSKDSPPELQKSVLGRFSLPYQTYRELHNGQTPQRVLILGAGTGNDVNIALINGVAQVTAVEIDPVIANLGRNLNPTQPYSSPRVRLLIDDARHFLQSSREQFDLIVFGTLDSQTLLSGVANLRLENYVYTLEALQQARERLSSGGMVCLYYSVFKPWLYQRIFSTVYEAFPDAVRMYFSQSSFLFNTVILAGKDLPGFKSQADEVAQYGQGLPSRDDWPFLYLERPTLADIYLKLLGAVIALVIIAIVVQRRVYRTEPVHLNFLALGLGFTLLESAAIVRMALLFGSTWIVNAVVFAAVLSMIFISNLLVHSRRVLPLRYCWVALLLALAFNALLPVGILAECTFTLRILACAALVGVPVFFAASAFSTLFEAQPHTGNALGMNLIGAMSGGFLEYFSMLWGMRAIWWLLIVVYALAWIASENRERRLEDQSTPA